MIERIEELNNKIYKLSSECYDYAHQELISKEQFQLILQALYDGYSMEYELLKLDLEKEFKLQQHEKEVRNSFIIPKYKRYWYSFWKRTPNRSASYIDEGEGIEAEKYFVNVEERNAKRQEELEAMLGTVEETDVQTDETPEQTQTPEKEPKTRRKSRDKIEPTKEMLEQIKDQISINELGQPTGQQHGGK